MKNTAVELERLCDAITLLKRGPHTAREIALTLGVRPAAARTWCRIYAYKGHAMPTTKLVRGQVTEAWEWA